MRKEIDPELFNYNKFPGPQFVSFDDIVKSDDIQFTMLENFKNAFDTTTFSQRFSELMLKYDYIVGDWASDQLRLKGFYKNDKKTTSTLKISRLEDYLKEYCSFGCAYFILENKEPKEMPKEEFKGHPRKRKQRRKNNNHSQKSLHEKNTNSSIEKNKRNDFKKKKKMTKKHTNKQKTEKSFIQHNQNFVIRKKNDHE
ncbi:YutD family protein [Streptococcus marimammalium]|uniref:YutD family protein n=1 Tax=Streptococcus marimammalium TaxID=269666 RepID=UPI000381CAEC|nr:YutD-like domain-containing protein [Streptococcus marimammalium]